MGSSGRARSVGPVRLPLAKVAGEVDRGGCCGCCGRRVAEDRGECGAKCEESHDCGPDYSIRVAVCGGFHFAP